MSNATPAPTPEEIWKILRDCVEHQKETERLVRDLSVQVENIRKIIEGASQCQKESWLDLNESKQYLKHAEKILKRTSERMGFDDPEYSQWEIVDFFYEGLCKQRNDIARIEFDEVSEDYRIYAGVATMSMGEGIEQMAENNGLYVFTQSGTEPKLMNPVGFQPRVF